MIYFSDQYCTNILKYTQKSVFQQAHSIGPASQQRRVNVIFHILGCYCEYMKTKKKCFFL